MTFSDAINSLQIWHVITRLGEAEFLLTAAALTMVILFFRSQTRKLALVWLLLLSTAVAITTASKVAFIGWGIGWAEINFTGFSGHAMFSAAVYPLLMMTFLGGHLRGNHRLFVALGLGGAIALLIGISRVQVGAHSWSEVVAGLALGGAVSATAVAITEASLISIRPIVPVFMLAWIALMPFELHASQTHSLVTRIALAMSGNETPYRRIDLLRHVRRQSGWAARG